VPVAKIALNVLMDIFIMIPKINVSKLTVVLDITMINYQISVSHVQHSANNVLHLATVKNVLQVIIMFNRTILAI